jgi:hypothetical protein
VGESSQIGGKEKNWSRIGGRREAAGTAVAQDGAELCVNYRASNTGA